MFNQIKEYSKDIRVLINNIERNQEGVQIIFAQKRLLPINKYNISISITKPKKLNIIEEFIIKISLSNIGEPVTSNVIQSMLGLDEIIINEFIDNLIKAGIISKSHLPIIYITDLGKDQFKKGESLVEESVKNLNLYIQPEYKLYYGKEIDENKLNDSLDISDNNININSLENDKLFIKRLNEIAKQEKLILTRDTTSQFISGINHIKPLNLWKRADFIEVWIYDMIEDKLNCRIWDCQLNIYNDDFSEFVSKNDPIDKNKLEFDSNVKKYTNKSKNIYENKYIEEIKQARSCKDKFESSLKMIRGADIKSEFTRLLKSAKKYLYIQSPWISKQVVDKEMLEIFKKLVNSGCNIFISWGIADEYSKEDRKPSDDLINELKNIKKPNGLPGVNIYWIGNHHDKELIVDDNYHLAGSFNWLSYRGDYLPRGESVYLTNSKQAIIEAKYYWENQLFKKIVDNSANEDYIELFNTLINLESIKEDVNDYLTKEIDKLIKLKNKFSYLKLYNISLIYFKNKLFDENYIKILDNLINKEIYLNEIYFMLDYLKNNNCIEIYNILLSNNKSKLIKNNILDDNMKLKKEITEEIKIKNLAFKNIN